MSHEAVDWALDYAPMVKNPSKGNNTNARLVLVALARHASADGTDAFPAQGTIEYVTGLSESSVKRALAALEKAGLIVRAGTRGSGVINWSLMMRHQRPAVELAEHRQRKDDEREAKAHRMARLRAERAGQADTHIPSDSDSTVDQAGGCAGQGDTHMEPEPDTVEDVCGHPDTPVQASVTARAGQGDPVNLPRTSLGTVSARKAGAAPLTHAEDEETNEVFEPDMHDWADELADEEDSGPASYPDSRPGVVEFKDGQDEDESASAEVPSSRDGSEPGGYEQANDLPAVKDPFEDWGVEAWGAWKRRNAVVAQQYRPDFLAALARKASEGDEIAARRLADLKLPAPPLRQLAG